MIDSTYLLVDAAEDVVIELPRLIEIRVLAGARELFAPLVRLLEVATEGLLEGDLAQRLGTLVRFVSE